MYYINKKLSSSLSRYDMQKFINPDNDFVDFVDSYFINEITSLSLGGKMIVQGEGGKPDLLSSHIYGSTQFWWVLMLYNGLVSSEDLVEGMTINYPGLSQLQELYFQLNSKRIASI